MLRIDIISAVQYSLNYQIVFQAIMYCTKQYIDMIVIVLYWLIVKNKHTLTYLAMITVSLFYTLNMVRAWDKPEN